MDQAVNHLLSMESVYLAVTVVIVTFFARRITETAAPQLKETAPATPFGRWWNGVILYAIPVVAGACLGMAAVASGWEVIAPTTLGGGALYGCVVGWFASFLYKVFRKALKKTTGIDPMPGPASVTKPTNGD